MQIAPTPITSSGNLIPLGSPVYVNIESTSSYTHARIKLWAWDGNVTEPFVNSELPNTILYKEKVSPVDTNVLFEIGEYLKDLFEPSFVYNTGSLPVVSNEGIYFKYEYEIIDNPLNSSTEFTLIESGSSFTYFGTQGYNWNYEGAVNLNNINLSFGLSGSYPTQFYDDSIIYTTASFNTTGVTSSAAMINRVGITPPTNLLKCNKEPFVIVYLDKRGLYNYFTPFGKVSYTNKIEREDYTKTYRNPHIFNNSVQHAMKQYNTRVESEYLINTGFISEDQGQLIEEILYSPSVYLIQFKKTSLSDLDYYNIYKQIPVIVTDTDFGRKTRLNDKNKISYNIKFKETTDKIRNIR